jgi:hypothetical protein
MSVGMGLDLKGNFDIGKIREFIRFFSNRENVSLELISKMKGSFEIDRKTSLQEVLHVFDNSEYLFISFIISQKNSTTSIGFQISKNDEVVNNIYLGMEDFDLKYMDFSFYEELIRYLFGNFSNSNSNSNGTLSYDCEEEYSGHLNNKFIEILLNEKKNFERLK